MVTTNKEMYRRLEEMRYAVNSLQMNEALTAEMLDGLINLMTRLQEQIDELAKAQPTP